MKLMFFAVLSCWPGRELKLENTTNHITACVVIQLLSPEDLNNWIFTVKQLACKHISCGCVCVCAADVIFCKTKSCLLLCYSPSICIASLVDRESSQCIFCFTNLPMLRSLQHMMSDNCMVHMPTYVSVCMHVSACGWWSTVDPDIWVNHAVWLPAEPLQFAL